MSAGEQVTQHSSQRTHVVRVLNGEQMGPGRILPSSPHLGKVRTATP